MWWRSLQFYSPCIHGSKTDMSLEHLLHKWEEIRRGCSSSCSGQAVLEEKYCVKMTLLTLNWPRHKAFNFHILVINSRKMTFNSQGIVGGYRAESITLIRSQINQMNWMSFHSLTITVKECLLLKLRLFVRSQLLIQMDTSHSANIWCTHDFGNSTNFHLCLHVTGFWRSWLKQSPLLYILLCT